MKAKWLLVLIGAMLAASAANAAVATCASFLTPTNTWAQIVANANGNGTSGSACTIGDMVVYGATASGTGAAGTVSVDQFDPLLERGFNITLNTASAWTIGYSIELCTATISADLGGCNLTNPAEFINTVINQTLGDNNYTTNDSYAVNGGSPNTFHTGPGVNNNFVASTNGTNVTFSLGQGAAGTIISTEADVEAQVGPEPGTMALMGGALIGLAAYVRKRRKA